MSYSEVFDEVIEVAENEEKSPRRRKENVKKRLAFDSDSPMNASQQNAQAAPARVPIPDVYQYLQNRRSPTPNPIWSPSASPNVSDAYNNSAFTDTIESIDFESAKSRSNLSDTPDSRMFESARRSNYSDSPGSRGFATAATPGQTSYILGTPDVRMFSTPLASSPIQPASTKARRDSIIEWFDKSIEAELHRRQQDGRSPELNLLDSSGTGHPSVMMSTINSVDLEASMRGGMGTDMNDAIDSFIRAQALVAFEGAIRAAEEAAASAPPEFAEEAAVAGAKDYQAELTSVVRQKIPGVKPVEVVGYVGITRPKFRKRKN